MAQGRVEALRQRVYLVIDVGHQLFGPLQGLIQRLQGLCKLFRGNQLADAGYGIPDFIHEIFQGQFLEGLGQLFEIGGHRRDFDVFRLDAP